MRLKKILMVEPRSAGHNVYSYVHLPRLGLPILGTIASRLGFDVRIVLEETHAVRKADIRSFDLLCISTITPTSPSAYELADKAKAMGVAVVIGGPHASFCPEEALEHAQWVLKGEAERSFEKFLGMLQGQYSPEQVPGLVWMRDGQLISSPLEAEPADMDRDVPIPDFSLMWEKKEFQFHRGVIPVQTSRGCPHHCSFCSVTPMFGRKVRYTSKEKVAEELNRRRGKGDQIFFYDDNFCASPSRTKELLEHFLSNDVFLPRPLAQVSVDAAMDEELIKLMGRAKFEAVFVGFESISDEALALYHKRQAIDDMRLVLERFHQQGTSVHGMFVTGSDAEDLGSIEKTVRFALDEGIDSIQLLVLTPLPGTALMSELEQQERIITKDWSLYDTHHAVFEPVNMSAYELMDETFRGMAHFYNSLRSLKLLATGRVSLSLRSFWARAQVHRWRRENKKLLKDMKHRGKRRHLGMPGP